MTCADVTELLDAFLDAELPGPMLLTIARHAGACTSCDATIRDLTALHDVVERTARAAGEALDLSGVWLAAEARMTDEDAARVWRRRLRAAPAWAAVGMAMAAGAVLWLRTGASEPTRLAGRPRPNQAVIERLDTSSHFELRRERKNGTTLIMVSAEDAGTPR